MGFLAPLFLMGLAAIAVPVLVHLVNRERRTVVHFPSLMFLERVQHKSVRRRRIRNWALLALRCLAFAALATAFARPLVRRATATTVGVRGAREDGRRLMEDLRGCRSGGLGRHESYPAGTPMGTPKRPFDPRPVRRRYAQPSSDQASSSSASGRIERVISIACSARAIDTDRAFGSRRSSRSAISDTSR